MLPTSGRGQRSADRVGVAGAPWAIGDNKTSAAIRLAGVLGGRRFIVIKT